MVEFPLENLGPLAGWVGVWEGDQGHDIAPSDDRGTETNSYRERMTFVPFGPVNNHEQTLYGLRYTISANRHGETSSLHDEQGYWLWDARTRQVMRCLMIPRGVTLLAGGTLEPGARVLNLVAERGSPTYGICSNPFLDEEFRTVRFELKVEISADGTTMRYEQDSQIEMKGQEGIFHHRDSNVLTKVD